jgi:1-phosphatidylinositol-4-phosphate 5-kinase
LGIIDTLTNYDAKKKAEHFFKSIAFGDTISAIPPKEYADRFFNFIENIVEII